MSVRPILLADLKHPAVLLATGFGIGLIRYAPGTWGSLPGVAAAWFTAALPWYWALCCWLLAAAAGVAICAAAQQRLGVCDHGGIVWDEIVGMWLALLWLPFEVLSVLLAFVLFRLLDILKPWPISWVDAQVSGGVGVVLDDVLAGGAAAALTLLALSIVVVI